MDINIYNWQQNSYWSHIYKHQVSLGYTSSCFRNIFQSMGDKSVETLCNKIEFLSILVTFPPLPPKQCWFFYFFDCTDDSTYTILNWGAGGITELTLEASKIEQMLKYRKASFPKSVSTTFVAHWVITKQFGSHLAILGKNNFLIMWKV